VRSKTDEYARRLYAATVEADDQVLERVREVAASHGVPPARIALAWMFHKPWITAPIIGASKPHHLEDAVAALSIKLTTEEIGLLEQPYAPHNVAGPTPRGRTPARFAGEVIAGCGVIRECGTSPPPSFSAALIPAPNWPSRRPRRGR